jgi:hypothetical protein
MSGLSLSEITRALGGKVVGNIVRAPGPGHSDRARFAAYYNNLTKTAENLLTQLCLGSGKKSEFDVSLRQNAAAIAKLKSR